MGAVYKARHKKMNRLVALKVINAKLLDKAKAVERSQLVLRSENEDLAGELKGPLRPKVEAWVMARFGFARGMSGRYEFQGSPSHGDHYERDASGGDGGTL